MVASSQGQIRYGLVDTQLGNGNTLAPMVGRQYLYRSTYALIVAAQSLNFDTTLS